MKTQQTITTYNNNKMTPQTYNFKKVMEQIQEAACDYWIDWNFDCNGYEWGDNEEEFGLQHSIIWDNKIDKQLNKN
tara:strand:+ start:500 stop:727 length:228 start_codon:yes stop_codon:yes gene_type:complete